MSNININTLVLGDLSHNQNLYYSYSQIDESLLSDISEWGKDKLDRFVENIKNITKHHEHNSKSIEDQLKSHKVNVNKLRSLASKIAKKHVFKFQKNDGVGFIDLVKHIGESINSGLNTILPNHDSIPRKILVGIILLMFADIFNTSLHLIGVALFGPIGGSLLSACLGAPISEELGKIISINQDAGNAYFIIFNIAEWWQYVSTVLRTAAGFPAIAFNVLLRFICVGFHYALTKIHEAHSKDEKTREQGLKMGMTFHALWNLLAHFPVVSVIQMPIMLYMAKRQYDNKMKKK